MSEVVKTHRIKKSLYSKSFHFKKSTPRKILSEIASKYSSYLIEDPDDELVDITTSDWYREMEMKMKPGDYLKHLRQALGLSQKALGGKIGISAAHVSDFETGQRSISKAIAKKLADLFGASTAVFI